VQRFPETPPLTEDPELSGHVWVQELVTGEPLRFRVAPSGLVEFGTRGEVFGSDGVPLRFGCAARSVRESLDLSALRGSVDDTESVTFFGTATLYDGLDYDWSELPAFVGVDVWSDEKDGYLTPDAASKAYSSLGLTPLPAFEKETAAGRAPLDAYASGDLPESRFRDGPAAGVLVRDKSGGRGEARRSTPEGGADPDGVARYVTDDRIGAVLRTRDNVRSVDVSVGHRVDLANATRLALARTTAVTWTPTPSSTAWLRASSARSTPACTGATSPSAPSARYGRRWLSGCAGTSAEPV